MHVIPLLITGDVLQGMSLAVKALYTESPNVQLDSWPPVRQSKVINLAIINNENFLTNKLSRQTVQGTLDDIYEGKEGISFEDLFSEFEPGTRVLIEGRPGCGKTTLMSKVSRSWAKGQILQKITLLLLIPLRQFYNQASLDLTDFVRCLFPQGYCNAEKLIEALSRREDICIVLDGVDEYKHSREAGNLVYELLTCRKLSRAVVIAASRPVATHVFRRFATKRVEVLGFLKPQIGEYLAEYYQREEEKVAKLQQYLEVHPKVHHMCYLPLHLAMVVYLNDVLNEDGSMPTNETEMYKLFTTHTLLRNVNKDPSYPERMENLATPEDLPPDIFSVFNGICDLAFNQTRDSRAIFSKKEVDGVFGKKDVILERLGLLTIDKRFASSGVVQTYSFLHLTLQEYLAAYYISQLSAEEVTTIFKDYGMHTHMKEVWKFYCGITKLRRKEHGMKVFELMARHMHRQDIFHLLHCVSESQSKDAVALLLSIIGGTINIHDKTLLPVDCMALAYVVNNSDQGLCDLTILSCRLDTEEFRLLFQGVKTQPGLKLLR